MSGTWGWGKLPRASYPRNLFPQSLSSPPEPSPTPQSPEPQPSPPESGTPKAQHPQVPAQDPINFPQSPTQYLGAQVSHSGTPESGIHRARGPPSLVPQCLAPPESSSPSLGPEAPAASPATLPTQQLQAPISQGTKVLTCVLAASRNGACK